MTTTTGPVTIHDNWECDSLVIQYHRRGPLPPHLVQYAQPSRPTPDAVMAFPGDWETVPDGGLNPRPGLSIRREDACALLEALTETLGVGDDLGTALETLETQAALIAHLQDELAEARQDAIVKAMEAVNWECLALEKDANMESVRAHLDREAETVNLERRRLERAETPPRQTPAALEPFPRGPSGV